MSTVEDKDGYGGDDEDEDEDDEDEVEDEDDDEDEVDRRGVGGGPGRREGGRVAVGHLRRLITFLTNLKLYSEIKIVRIIRIVRIVRIIRIVRIARIPRRDCRMRSGRGEGELVPLPAQLKTN